MVKVGIVFFWMSVFLFFLYVPEIVHSRIHPKELHVLVLSNLINANYIDQFEKEHQIKVHLSYAETSEEILVKMRATQGRGYDLIMAADYQVAALIKQQLIQFLDKKKLPFLNKIYPSLLNHYFDPDNHYSVPYFWGVFGLGIDKKYFGDRNTFSWKDLFDEKIVKYCIGMREDPRELISIAAYYLFGRIHNLGHDEFKAIKQLLIQQKKWVTLYADERVGMLLVSGSCPLILTTSGDVIRVLKRYSQFDFVVPKEGSFLDITSFVIPRGAYNVDAAHAFLAYIYQEKVISNYMEYFSFFSPLKTINSDKAFSILAIPTLDMIKQLQFFDVTIPQDILNDIIFSLKTA